MRQAVSIALLCIFTFAQAPSLLEWYLEQEDSCGIEEIHFCDSENHDEEANSFTLSNGYLEDVVLTQDITHNVVVKFSLQLRNTSTSSLFTIGDRAPPLV